MTASPAPDDRAAAEAEVDAAWLALASARAAWRNAVGGEFDGGNYAHQRLVERIDEAVRIAERRYRIALARRDRLPPPVRGLPQAEDRPSIWRGMAAALAVPVGAYALAVAWLGGWPGRPLAVVFAVAAAWLMWRMWRGSR